MTTIILCNFGRVGTLKGRGHPRATVEVSGGKVRIRLDDAREHDRWTDLELDLATLIDADAGALADVEAMDDVETPPIADDDCFPIPY